MKNDIIKKLKKFIILPMDDLYIVYLFVQIRKLLYHREDLHNINKYSYEVLKFYCDWVVHIELERKRNRQAKNILFELEKVINDCYLNNAPDDIMSSYISAIISFKKLQNELILFFRNYGLPNDILDKDKWDIFILAFFEVISDCPLKTDVKIDKFKNYHIEQFSITKRHNDYFQWKIIINDKTNFSCGLIGKLNYKYNEI